MLGALRLMGFGIDPMNMLTPFLIFAIAVSHGEQMINRFRGEIFFGGLEEGTVDELRAARPSASTRWTPPQRASARCWSRARSRWSPAASASARSWCIPIRMIIELAITATIGVALTILTDLILLPVLLSYTQPAQPRAQARVSACAS